MDGPSLACAASTSGPSGWTPFVWGGIASASATGTVRPASSSSLETAPAARAASLARETTTMPLFSTLAS